MVIQVDFIMQVS